VEIDVQGRRLLSGPTRFVLGGSGHIAGIVNPPSAKKYDYWTGSELPESARGVAGRGDPERRFVWIDWQDWIAGLNGPDGRRPAFRARGHCKPSRTLRGLM